MSEEKDILKDEFAYFLKHHDEIYAGHPNEYVVIKGSKVLLSGNTFEEALDKAVGNGLEVGTFIIQLCTPGDEGYTQSFHSRVIFA
ncbi:MAG: hypothetical protein LUC26_01715 [Prevotella sp.]|nr:hypothetical protein [Prevotella sp.]